MGKLIWELRALFSAKWSSLIIKGAKRPRPLKSAVQGKAGSLRMTKLTDY